MEPTASSGGRASWQAHAYHKSLRETSLVGNTFYGPDDVEKKQQDQKQQDRPDTPDSEDLSVVSVETRAVVLGSTELYENGKLRFIPVSYTQLTVS